MTFDVASAVPLPPIAFGDDDVPAAALIGTNLYAASLTDLTLVDTQTGAVVSSVGPDNPPVRASDNGQAPPRPPRIVTIDQTTVVLASFLVQPTAGGTTRSPPMIEIVAADAATGQRMWSLALPLNPWNTKALDPVETDVVTGPGNIAVVTAYTQFQAASVAVDLASRTQVWAAPGFAAGAIVDQTVVGGFHRDDVIGGRFLSGIALSDGTQTWTTKQERDLTVEPAGPVFVTAASPSYFAIVRATDGTILDSAASILLGDVPCFFDGRDATVCTMSGWASAFDATSGEELWELTDETPGRIAPHVTGAWHGAVYGTTSNGPVVLDARTGTDRQTSPGAAPYLVNEYVGIADALDGNGLAAYAATG